MKILQLILFLLITGIHAQNKDASNFFESHSIYWKVNNALSFIEKSNTILINEYEKSVIYALVTPMHENAFVVSLKNKLPILDKKQLKCFKINDNRFVVFVDRSEENFGETESYKKNFELKTKEVVSCDGLFKKLKENKLPKIPENVFAYAVFEGNFVYLEDLATFDALQYLEIEYDLNRSN
ncbi:hypothetical protein DRF60_20690 [Chryseobacterium elymi]|uniref:Uncharacterized protein n=1 Tax=Chryseobacterium elymi TaxID=395936 RepID=A0A3D9CZU3_9FLAO|nr:hypothetical protein [Chryseobacterium elymi]REC71168.1 hypothetical protein DRF60_20690 [Chryseobacterium elymi]